MFDRAIVFRIFNRAIVIRISDWVSLLNVRLNDSHPNIRSSDRHLNIRSSESSERPTERQSFEHPIEWESSARQTNVSLPLVNGTSAFHSSNNPLVKRTSAFRSSTDRQPSTCQTICSSIERQYSARSTQHIQTQLLFQWWLKLNIHNCSLYFFLTDKTSIQYCFFIDQISIFINPNYKSRIPFTDEHSVLSCHRCLGYSSDLQWALPSFLTFSPPSGCISRHHFQQYSSLNLHSLTKKGKSFL